MPGEIRIEQDGDDVLVWVKAVPGASRDTLAGALGDRLKVRVSAAPEDGQANKAICRLLARVLGRRPGEVEIESGATRPEKVVRVRGSTTNVVRDRVV